MPLVYIDAGMRSRATIVIAGLTEDAPGYLQSPARSRDNDIRELDEIL